MTLEESDSHATAIFRLASIASIFVLIASGFLFCMIAEDVERFGHVYGEMVSELQTIRTESTDLVDYKLREKRQSFFRNNQYRTGFGGRHKTSFRNGDAPKICDCMVVQCPRGARGPPGQDGELAEDGAPGVAGKPGLDGVYLVEEIQCPPCPRGPRGPDGDAGEKGEAGKPGVGGIPGHDGTNEPGPMGEPGSRGQSGRSGKRGPPGEIGQDAVQLIGVPGVKGPDGPIGFQGPRGDPGENGNPAPPGPEGLSGTTGEPGDEGEYGPRGPPGRKGSQGPDGGYCQCPPREGAGIATSAGTDSMPLTWEEYRRGSIRTVAIPESSRPFSRKLPAIPRLPQLPELPSLPQTGDEDEDTYPRSPAYNFQHRGYIDVPQAKISHSPMTPLIDYRDSREGVNNRVVMSRKRPSPVVRGSSVDFDLRRRL